MAAERDIWFEYYHVGHRLKAYPVNAKGWVSLLALVSIPLALPIFTMSLFGDDGPATFVVSLVTTLALVFFTILYLLRTRGRERR